MQKLDDKMIYEEKANILKALAHPIRLCITKRLLDKGSCNVNTMKDHLGIPQSTVSQYLAKLKNAGIIADDRQGTVVNYYIDNPTVAKIIKELFE